MTKTIVGFLTAALFALILVPNASQATMLGPCDHQNSWGNLKIGDKDTNISDIGPIAGLQQLVGEADIVNSHNQGGMGPMTYGVYDEVTRTLLINWQVKHGIISTSGADPERGIIGVKTKTVIKNYCGGGETTTYVLQYPRVGGGFDAVMAHPISKYTNRVADHALRILIDGGPGAGSVSTTGGTVFSPFNWYDLKQNGLNIGKDGLYMRNYYLGVALEDSVATVTFENGALPFFDTPAVLPLVQGSIERTLKQFPTITSVRIRIIASNHSAPPTVIRTFGGESGAVSETESKIAALKAQITQLVQIIAQLLKAKGLPAPAPLPMPGTCFVPTFNLVIGSTDAKTNGEVSKLQAWLKSEGYFPDAQVTGYYGEKTAAAIVKWQKAHGMDFVTLQSGVGKMTRAKMQEKCTGPNTHSVHSMAWKTAVINPNAESYKAHEQNITVYLLFKDGTERKYVVGNAYGCPAETSGKPEIRDEKNVLGSLNCYYALTGTQFIAYMQGDAFIVERGAESAKDGSVTWTRVLEERITTTPSANRTYISSLSGLTVLAAHQMGTWTAQIINPKGDKLRYIVRWGDEPSPMDIAHPVNWLPYGYATEYFSTTVTHIYSKPGTYNLKFIALDNELSVSEKNLTIVVQ